MNIVNGNTYTEAITATNNTDHGLYSEFMVLTALTADVTATLRDDSTAVFNVLAAGRYPIAVKKVFCQTAGDAKNIVFIR